MHMSKATRVFSDKMSESDRFRLYYLTNYWGDDESPSGYSSRLSETGSVRSLLADLFRLYPEAVLVDLGCGRVGWIAQDVVPATAKYIGVDVVPEVIQENRLDARLSAFEFVVGDVRDMVIPKGDVVVVRDVLGHLSPGDVRLTLSNAISSGPDLLLATTFRGSTAGQAWRTANHCSYDLEASRFDLGPADRFFPENESVTRDGSIDRGIGAWAITAAGRQILLGLGGVIEDLPTNEGNILERTFDPDVVAEAICADGRGRAFMCSGPSSPGPAGQEASGPSGVDVLPRLITVGALERRMTKSQAIDFPAGDSRIVLGTRGIVQSSASGRTGQGFFLATCGRGLQDPEGVLGLRRRHGLLQSHLRIAESELVQVPRLDPVFLHAYSFAAIDAIVDKLAGDRLYANGPVLIIGSDAFALCVARSLESAGVSAQVCGVPAPDGVLGQLALEAGLTYRSIGTIDTQERFGGVVVTPGHSRVAQSVVPRIRAKKRIVVVGGHTYGSVVSADSFTLGDQVLPAFRFDTALVRKAVRVIEAASDGEWLRSLFLPAVSLEDYDLALFPRYPVRLGLVEIGVDLSS